MNAPAKTYSFSKKERLTHKKMIEELFKNGSFFHLNPLQIRFLSRDDLTNNQVLISVSKKYHKKAVSRNKIKRRLREAYRLNKHLLPEAPMFLVAILYLSKDEMSFEELQNKLTLGLKRLGNQIIKNKQ
jgi:ribonuclease P protein component